MNRSGPSSGADNSSQNSRIWLALAFVGVLFLSLPNLQYPIGRDQATYCLIAHSLLKGKLLYRDLWDNKPPGIFYIYIPIVKIFGRALWTAGVVDILCVLIVSLCTFFFCRRHLGAPTAALAAVLYTYFHDRPGYINAAQPEVFLIIFVFASYFLIANEKPWPAARNVAAGLALGAAFWTKYNAIVFLPLIAVLPYLDTNRLGAPSPTLRLNIPWRTWTTRTFFLLSGFALAVAGVLALFWTSGAWPAMKEVQFEVLPRYGSMVIARTPHYFLWALGQTGFNLGPLTEAGIPLGLFIAWRTRELHRTTPVFLAFAAGYLTTATQARFNAYSFETCFPFIAMIWAYIALKIFEGSQKASQAFARRGWTVARFGVWIIFLNLIYFPLPAPAAKQVEHYEGLLKWWRNPEKSYQTYWWALSLEHLDGELDVAHYLKNRTTANDQVFVWGTAPLIYLESGRACPSRFVSNLGLISAWTPAGWRAELVRDLEAIQPRFIVVERRDAIPAVSYTTLDSEEFLIRYPALGKLLTTEYQSVQSFKDFVIYSRRQPLSGAGAL